MKKIFVLLLAGISVILITACNNFKKQNNGEFLIDIVDISDIENGRTYQEIKYSQIKYNKNHSLQNSLNILNEEMKKEAESFKEDNKDAIREFLPEYIEFSNDENAKYEYYSNVSVLYENDKYFSLVENTYEFLLGAHGGTIIKGYTYDINTGKMLTLDDFINSRDELKEFVKAWIRKEKEKDDIFFPEAEETIDTLLSENGRIEFYLNGDGLNIVFQQYDIAPYAYGLIAILIDKRLLKSNIDL